MNHDSATSAVSIPLTWREFVRAIADLPAGAEPNLNGMSGRAQQLLASHAQVQADATTEMLDMLGGIVPLAMHDKKDRDQWYERLCRARAVQQPLPVPDQAAVVWRSDLVRAVAELIQLRAYRDLVRAERARKETAQPSDAAQAKHPDKTVHYRGLGVGTLPRLNAGRRIWGTIPKAEEPAPEASMGLDGKVEGLYFVQTPQPEIILTISQDGVLTFGEHVTPKDAAQAIKKEWEKLRQYDEGAHAIDLVKHLRERATAKGYAAIESAIDAAPDRQQQDVDQEGGAS